MTASLVVASEIHALDEVDQWVEQLARDWEIPRSTRFAIKLCCEESFCNIVLHGVGRRRAAAEAPDTNVRLAMTRLPTRIDLSVEDRGAPFDPLSVAPPRHGSLTEAGIGGNGIHLMRRFSQQITYERRDDRNLLVMSFNLGGSTASPSADQRH